MQSVRSVAAQCYRRGKPLGRRDFSSSPRRSFHNGVDVVMKSASNVIETMFYTSLALGLGTGMGYLIMGYSNSSEYLQQVEENRERKKLQLDELEAFLERSQKRHVIKRDV